MGPRRKPKNGLVERSTGKLAGIPKKENPKETPGTVVTDDTKTTYLTAFYHPKNSNDKEKNMPKELATTDQVSCLSLTKPTMLVRSFNR